MELTDPWDPSAGLPRALHDAHVHLDFMQNGEEVARDAAADGVVLFANTVTPEGWKVARGRFAEFENVRVGFGMHPWWVETLCPQASGGGPDPQAPGGGPGSQARDGDGDGSQALGGGGSQAPGSGGGSQGPGSQAPGSPGSQALDLRAPDSLEALLERDDPRLLGEVGLDFSKRHVPTRELQIATFSKLARWAGQRGDRVLSIHSARAAKETLDILEAEGALDTCTCIFHWYSGPSDQLKRAIEAGCLFSVNERMLATGKGREYAKAIPATRLLLETDAPPRQGQPYSYAKLKSELVNVARAIAQIKG